MMNERNTRPMPSLSPNWNRAAKRTAGKARRQAARRLCVDFDEEVEAAPVAVTQASGTMRLVLISQVYENYGAHDWDGKGQCPSYWKAKGGSEYVVNLTMAKALELGGKGLNQLASEVASKYISRNDNYFQEWLIDWTLAPANEKTEMESWGIEPKNLPCMVF